MDSLSSGPDFDPVAHLTRAFAAGFIATPLAGTARRRPPRGRRAMLSAALTVVALTAMILIVPSLTTPAQAALRDGVNPSLSVPPNGQLYLGVSTDLARLDTFDNAAGIAGGHPAIYGRWTTPDGPFQPTLDDASSRPGMTPMVTWNLPMSGGQITNGSRDAYILSQARAVQAYAKPVFIRLDWEMNAFWYPEWNLNNVTPSRYIASWRHAVTLFRSVGVPNARFVWAPNNMDYFTSTGARIRTSAWYPGDSYVDWMGLDAYPLAADPNSVLNATDGMNDMADFAAAHGKAMMLAEWATNTPHADTPDPVNLVFDWAAAHPNTVKALVYFDFVTQGKDFTLADRPVGAATYRSRSADRTRFLTSMTGSSPIPDPSPTPAPVVGKLPNATGHIVGLGGKCLDIPGSNAVDGARLQIYSCNNTSAQSWTTSGAGTIEAMSKCLDVLHSGTSVGTPVQLYDCNASDAQTWTPASMHGLRNPHSNLCLSLVNATAADGDQLELDPCDTRAGEAWTLP